MFDNTSFSVETNGGRVTIVGLPQHCPNCHRHIRPYALYGYLNHYQTDLSLLLVCPNRQCDKAFFGYYTREEVGSHPDLMKTQYWFIEKTNIGTFSKAPINQTVELISPTFMTIYNQAYHAEQSELLEICGMGYRKALEFLIKDYAISKDPSAKEIIEKKALMGCITDYVSDTRIKAVAKRAVWLGNDETHYVRKWEGKNLTDLKKLIELTIHWIEMEKLTESFEADMPG
ncbi:hypothetical protein GCM10028824_09860 [Hymenobacter segetis]|uniref:DUF4145 domain-containing protein n=1 Tax=Hymenobacter segetis TaxID=2025509 RepID=A0ABU9LSH5_9BACT